MAGLGGLLAERPGEVVRGGACDLDLGVGAGAQRMRRREVHDPVLAGAPGEHRRVALARALDEHLLDAPDACLVGGECAALDDDAQAVEPLAGDARIDEAIGELGRFGARSRGEDERERVVEAGLGDDVERGGEVVVGLAREADDDVGGHGEVGDDAPGLGQPLQVAGGGVPPVHRREDPIRSGLERVVQLLAHGGCGRHRPERLGAHVLGVRRREAHPTDAVDAPGRLEQVGEERAQGDRTVAIAARRPLDVPAVAVDVLAEQRHLGHAVGGERLDLVDDLGERTTDLLPAHGGDDAERTAVVAPDLDRHPRVVGGGAPGRQGRREQGVVVEHGRLEDLGERTVQRRLAHQLGGAVDVVRAEHDVDVPARSRTRSRSFWARQPDTTIWRPSRPAFHVLRWPRLPYSLLSAFSRMQQVLSTTTSAASSDAAGTIPSAVSSPAMRSESCSFIWHP